MGAGVDGVGAIGADNSAGVDQQGFAVGSDDENGVTLTDVDGGDFEGCGAMLDRPRKYCNSGCDKKGGSGGCERKAFQADEQQSGRGEDDDGGNGEGLRRRNAEVAETHGSKGQNECVDSVKQKRDGHGGNYGEFGESEDQHQRKEGERQEDSEQGNDEDVDRQSDGGDAVEVDGHGQDKKHLDRKGGDDEFGDQKEGANRFWKDVQGERVASERHHRGREHADDHTELRDTRRERRVKGKQPEVLRCAKEWAEGLLSDRNSNTGNGEYRKQRHLEPGVQDCRGVDGQHHEGGKSDGVEPTAFSPQHAAAKVKRDHPESALNRLAEAGEERIEREKGQWSRRMPRCATGGGGG